MFHPCSGLFWTHLLGSNIDLGTLSQIVWDHCRAQLVEAETSCLSEPFLFSRGHSLIRVAAFLLMAVWATSSHAWGRQESICL